VDSEEQHQVQDDQDEGSYHLAQPSLLSECGQ
jgi:hypothetical protein